MKTSPIITLPDLRLRRPSQSVKQITDQTLATIAKMKQAAIDWEEGREHELSTALTAIQIGIPERIVIVRTDLDQIENCDFTTLINPEIVKLQGKTIVDFEGCLSVPDFYGKVPRKEKVKIKAKNERGETFFLKAEGFLARILQHEIDHANGIPFVDRIKNNPKAFYKLQPNGELINVDFQEVLASGIFRD